MLATEEMIPNRIEYRTTALRPVEARGILGDMFQLIDHPGASQVLLRSFQAPLYLKSCRLVKIAGKVVETNPDVLAGPLQEGYHSELNHCHRALRKSFEKRLLGYFVI